MSKFEYFVILFFLLQRAIFMWKPHLAHLWSKWRVNQQTQIDIGVLFKNMHAIKEKILHTNLYNYCLQAVKAC